MLAMFHGRERYHVCRLRILCTCRLRILCMCRAVLKTQSQECTCTAVAPGKLPSLSQTDSIKMEKTKSSGVNGGDWKIKQVFRSTWTRRLFINSILKGKTWSMMWPRPLNPNFKSNPNLNLTLATILTTYSYRTSTSTRARGSGKQISRAEDGYRKTS